MKYWLCVLAVLVASVCYAGDDGNQKDIEANVMYTAGRFRQGYTWLVPGQKVVYDVETIEIYRTQSGGKAQEKVTGTIELECTKLDEDKVSVTCTAQSEQGDVVDERGVATVLDLHQENPLALPYTTSRRGGVEDAFTEKEMAPAAVKIRNGKLYGTLFRAAKLSLLQLPPSKTKAGQGEHYFRWRGKQRINGAERQMLFDACPLGNKMVIIGKNDGFDNRGSSRGPDGGQGEEISADVPEEVAAIFEDGRITSAEYRLAISGRTTIVRVAVRAADKTSLVK